MSERDLQRWTLEVARDPGAPSFVQLARLYRRQGHRQAARDVVIRGLERSPRHVDARALLALLYMEDGDREGARDEWETLLQLEPQRGVRRDADALARHYRDARHHDASERL